MAWTVCQQLPHNVMLEILHVHYTGDVPEALTVNGIFQQGCVCGHAHWSKKSPDCHGLHNAFHKQNFLLRTFPPAVLKFSMFGPGKKQSCSKYSRTERIAPVSNPSPGLWFHCVLIPDLPQHMVLPPFSSFDFWFLHSENINWGEVYADGESEQQEALSVLGNSWHIWGWRAHQLNLTKCGYGRNFVFWSLERH